VYRRFECLPLRHAVCTAEKFDGLALKIATSEGPRVLACDVAEKMLQRVHDKYPAVRTCHADIVSLALASTSVDAIFMNGMYGNIADKSAACGNAARMLRSGGRLDL
jgi:ubiquinone/menaquinone biosynthesis C-methylase UbiE